MKSNFVLVGLVAVLGAVLLGSCGQSEPVPAATEKRLRIMTTFLPVDAHTRKVAGEAAEVTMLLGHDSGPHDFQIKPGDVRLLHEADLLVINGMGIEEWLEELVGAVGKDTLVVVDTSAGVEAMESPDELTIAAQDAGHSHDHGHGHSHSHGHGHGHRHGGDNPHIWLDPVIARLQVENILAALSAADPANAETYRTNAAVYLRELEDLDREYRETLGELDNKNLVTFHDAFPYLAARYGLNYVGFIEAFPEKDPPPSQLRNLVSVIQEKRIGVVFAEAGFSPKLMESLAAQSGARVMVLDTLEMGSSSPDAYLERMRNNLATLKKAWQE